MQNELRRTKEKLRLLEEPHIYWLLFDIIDATTCHDVDAKFKEHLVTKLKNDYLRFINRYKQDVTQFELFNL